MELEVRGLTKAFGPVTAVRDVSFRAPAGQVTGLLGPNGSGKTTTLRMTLGLVRPTAGHGADRRCRLPAAWPRPRRSVGALLEATGFHPGRRARDHLRVLAAADGRARPPGGRGARPGRPGRGRRPPGARRSRSACGSASASPPPCSATRQVLLLDEPANGLDPAGIAWLRGLLRDLAGEGRTIVVASHVLGEVAQTADHVLIVSAGRLRFAGPLREIGETASALESAFLNLTGEESHAAMIRRSSASSARSAAPGCCSPPGPLIVRGRRSPGWSSRAATCTTRRYSAPALAHAGLAAIFTLHLRHPRRGGRVPARHHHRHVPQLPRPAPGDRRQAGRLRR